MTEKERKELIFVISISSRYAEEYCESLPDAELEALYAKVTGTERIKGDH